MKFLLDGLVVYFPYTFIYPEQYEYMRQLKKALDMKGPCVLEMPTGTGKTVSLLSLITSYQAQYEQTGKLIYCCRTVGEVEKTMEELRRVIQYRDAEMGLSAPKTLCIALSSRKNLCIHPQVSEGRSRDTVDSRCRDMTASWRRERAKNDPDIELCDFYEGFQEHGVEMRLHGIFSLEDLKEFGRQNRVCPYFLARHCINFANVIVYSYQYLLNPRISDMVSNQLQKDAIVVFDEAHNIDNVCIDALSVTIDRQILDAGSRNLTALSNTVMKVKAHDAQRLQAEYSRLVAGLAQSGVLPTDRIRPDPVLPDDIVREAVPESIRKAEEFIAALRRLVDFLKGRLRIQQVTSETPSQLLKSIYDATQIDAKILKFCTSRLNSLLRTLELTELDKYSPIGIVCDFATLLGTYNEGFVIIMEPYDERTPTIIDPIMQLSCLDASLAMKPVVTKYGRVVITSGTLSPLDMLPRILGFTPVLTSRLPITLTRPCICPLVVTRGSDQTLLSTKYESRENPDIVRNYGLLLLQLAQIVPDGIVCFFPSYQFMESTVSMWNEMGILSQLLKYKLLFVETNDLTETSLALDNYKRACDSGRGGIFFSVARGKVSEGIDFDNHYGRCVILFGIPFVYTESRILKARLEYLREKFQIRENEFLSFDAMRNSAQCVGRIIRGKNDYGIMIFADKRYNRVDKRSKLPQWISQFLNEQHLNLSVDDAAAVVRTFLKEMAQPIDKESQIGVSLWTKEHVEQQPASRPQNAVNNAPNCTTATTVILSASTPSTTSDQNDNTSVTSTSTNNNNNNNNNNNSNNNKEKKKNKKRNNSEAETKEKSVESIQKQQKKKRRVR
jgi:DNA excision repair protein ERCC-2